ncbi:MAG: TatD DNase family protein [Bacteroidales bacterium]|jgi:TatD DNase family protein|nr:TatD DNase family protein [Bacteroidales bacterium]MDN5328417.1 TatD DNase family protein [Bacteroidales bacterium]
MNQIFLNIPNFHTHNPNSPTDALYNLLPPFVLPKTPPKYISAGIHPWYIDDNTENNFKKLEYLIKTNKLRAIGETGLDKLRGPNLELQIKVFETHIEWAQQFQFPLVIHCVRAHSEVLGLLRKHNFRSPVVFHGFRGNWSTALPLIEAGYFLSFGPSILNAGAPLIQSVQLTPLDQLLIETDDSQVSIEEIFRAIIRIKQISEESLADHLSRTFNALFN